MHTQRTVELTNSILILQVIRSVMDHNSMRQVTNYSDNYGLAFYSCFRAHVPV